MSVINLMLDDQWVAMHPDSPLAVYLRSIEPVLTVFFVVEMLVKIVALGLILHDNAYLRSAWNILDCVIVVFTYVPFSRCSR